MSNDFHALLVDYVRRRRLLQVPGVSDPDLRDVLRECAAFASSHFGPPLAQLDAEAKRGAEMVFVLRRRVADLEARCREVEMQLQRCLDTETRSKVLTRQLGKAREALRAVHRAREEEAHTAKVEVAAAKSRAKEMEAKVATLVLELAQAKVCACLCARARKSVQVCVCVCV
jgi:hypothetical protein